MGVLAIISMIEQIISAGQTLVPAVAQGVADFKALFADGAQPTEAEAQAHMDALVARVQSQSAQIQAIDP